MKLGTVLLGFSFLLSKIIGLLRDNLLASTFGAGTGSGIFNLDVYYVAFRLPDFLYNLLSYGVLSAAFVPLFIEILKKEGKSAAFRFTNQIFHTVGCVIATLSLILFFLAPYVLKLFVPGFPALDFDATVLLTRLMLITPLFFTIGSIAGGVQNALHTYIGLAIAPLLYNLGIIGGIIFLAPNYGVFGIGIGVVIGAILHTLIQLPAIFKAGFRFIAARGISFFWNPRIKEMVTLSLPRIFGMSVTQLSLVADTLIASLLASGSITIINFAANLESLPIGLIGISVAIVSFATLASHAAENNMQAFITEIRTNIRRILFILIPVAAGMAMLRIQIVTLLLGYGKFTAADVALTAKTLAFLLTGLCFGGIVFLLARAFYALKNTIIPVMIGICAVTLNIILSIALTRVWHFGTYGLAIANSAADILNATALIILLYKKIGACIIEGKEIFKFLVSAGCMALLVYYTLPFFPSMLTQLIGASMLGALTYFGFCALLGCKDIKRI